MKVRIATMRNLETGDDVCLFIDAEWEMVKKPGCIIDFFRGSKEIFYSGKITKISKIFEVDDNVVSLVNDVYPMNVRGSNVLRLNEYTSDHPMFYSKNRNWLQFFKENKNDIKLENYYSDAEEINEILFELWKLDLEYYKRKEII